MRIRAASVTNCVILGISALAKSSFCLTPLGHCLQSSVRKFILKKSRRSVLHLVVNFMQHSLNYQINMFQKRSLYFDKGSRQPLCLFGFQEWQYAQSRGCFYLEEDGEIISHKYRLHIPQRSTVCITIKPLNLRQVEGKCICISSEQFPL